MLEYCSRTLLVGSVICACISVQAQQDLEERPFQYGVTIEFGGNTSPSTSDFASSLSTQYAVGLLGQWRSEKRASFGIQFRFNSLSTKLSNVPYPFISDGGGFINENADQSISYRLLHLGGRVKYSLMENKLYLHGGLGFNYALQPKFKTKYSGGTTTFNLPVANNNVVSKPEIALGVGWQHDLGSISLALTPIYRAYVNVGSGNGLAHSVGLEVAVLWRSIAR